MTSAQTSACDPSYLPSHRFHTSQHMLLSRNRLQQKSSEEKLRALQVDLAAHLHDLETNYFALNHNTQQSLQ